VAWAALAPYYAVTIREAYILSDDGMRAALIYCFVSFIFSLMAFAAFRLRDGIARYFSVHDAGEIAKAVIIAELMTCTTLFVFTRLEGIPRSTPIIHALVLGAGLVVARGLVRVSSSRFGAPRYEFERKHIVMIGMSRLTALYIKFVEAVAPGEQQVIAVLDDQPETRGRSVHGVGIMGSTAELESIIEEFAVHGVRTHRVVVGLQEHEIAEQVLNGIRRTCAAHHVDLGFVPQLFGLKIGAEADPLP
jgi:FlaA1/EpsC-like NDP-sugar epimerase